VADPRPSLLERILGTECPDGCVLGTGLPCMGPASHMMFCASRIRAAEEAEAAKPKPKRGRPHRLDWANPMRIGGHLIMHNAYKIIPCVACGTLRNYDGKYVEYSHDGGVSWARGPDPCPGRTSADATKGE
jgi:hypothetical protein